MRKSKNYILPAIIVIAVVSIVLYKILSTANATDARRQFAPLVKVEKVLREDVLVKSDLNGDALPIRQASIFSKVSGNLEQNYVDMGSFVRVNQLLATIDSTELYQQYQEANATYTNARLTFKRVQQLQEKNLSSQQDVDNAEATMLVAKANYDAAATKLSYARITAPFSGYITKRYLDPGALVNATNSTLFSLMSLDSIRIIVNVPEKDVPYIYHIHTARVTFDALPGKEFVGIVSLISQSVDLATRTMAVQVNVPNPSHLIKPGMFASIDLVEAEHPGAITVPTNALLKSSDGMYLFVIDGKNAKRLKVEIGIEQNSRTEILSGLSGDEIAIIVGQQFVKEGNPVTIQQ
jgi:membrane fusion protein (multidrug efflux system)